MKAVMKMEAEFKEEGLLVSFTMDPDSGSQSEPDLNINLAKQNHFCPDLNL